MPIPSSDDSRPESDNHGSRRISREIAILQQDIRDDFDQKLRELSGLMVKFRSLLANERHPGSELPTAANDATNETNELSEHRTNQAIDKTISDVPADIPVLTDRISNESQTKSETSGGAEKTNRLFLVKNDPQDQPNTDSPAQQKIEPTTENSNKPVKPVSRFTTEPARFESGLYQLNSQLYRFKLELDQELEFREEPLHIHFQHQSELAKVLQQITEKMQQEKNIGR